MIANEIHNYAADIPLFRSNLLREVREEGIRVISDYKYRGHECVLTCTYSSTLIYGVQNLRL